MGKSGPNATFNLFFSWVGLALGWGVRRFHNDILYVFQPNIYLVNRKHPNMYKSCVETDPAAQT